MTISMADKSAKNMTSLIIIYFNRHSLNALDYFLNSLLNSTDINYFLITVNKKTCLADIPKNVNTTAFHIIEKLLLNTTAFHIIEKLI